MKLILKCPDKYWTSYLINFVMFYCFFFKSGFIVLLWGGSQQIYLAVIVCNLLPGIRSYEQLGYRAFGTPGKMAAGIAITLQNIGGEHPH